MQEVGKTVLHEKQNGRENIMEVLGTIVGLVIILVMLAGLTK